jgi:hypothetical protein
VPNATVPIGFYVHPNGTPGDIHIYNTDAHRNYVGYRFDGSASAIDLTNCRAYANRTYGLMEGNDIRRGVYDRVLNAVITTAISALITIYGRWWK